MAVRAPELREAARGFSLGGFAVLSRELDEGVELPFAFEEHRAPGRPALYEYRPLVAGFIESRAHALAARDDTRIALEALRREPAAAIFARAHAVPGAASDPEGGAVRDELGADVALFRSILLPLLVKTAEACGGFDWDDAAFEQAYADVETALFGEHRTYTALAPLVGLTLGAPVELAPGLKVRHAVAGELAAHWAEAVRLLPAGFGREPARLSLLELEQRLSGRAELPDAAGELADAVTAIRLATAGAVAAGPVLFERLDWRPIGVAPVLPIASTRPEGEPTRLDQFRGKLAGDVRGRLALADDDPELGEALDRWELSLFRGEPFRSEQLRASLATLLGDGDGEWAAAVRAAVLVGETARDRADLLASLRELVRGKPADARARDAVRRSLVEALLQGDRRQLVGTLDDVLLGTRPRPPQRLASTG